MKAVPGWMCSLGLGAAALLSVGCSTERRARPVLMVVPATAPAPTTGPATRAAAYEDADLEALCVPPAGWIDKGLKQGSNHIRRTWVNQEGSIGYGVVRAKLPLPVGESIVLSAFLAEVQRMQGRTTIIEKRSSDEGLTFVAQNPVLRYEGRVHCRGLRGWIVFASTLTEKPADAEHLKVAEVARDATVLGQ